ncbi:hypothetical protein [Nonlabens sp.]|uniref:hypothetical protein n=1 Tax=Nonlabens sp. TaxID=1888209 RepID=UPI003266C511
MAKKFTARKNQYNFKDIYELHREILKELRNYQAKSPYDHLRSSALRIALEKLSIAKNRLSAEHFIDAVYIEEQIKLIREHDPQASKFFIEITKKDENEEYAFPPYKINVRATL